MPYQMPILQLTIREMEIKLNTRTWSDFIQKQTRRKYYIVAHTCSISSLGLVLHISKHVLTVHFALNILNR